MQAKIRWTAATLCGYAIIFLASHKAIGVPGVPTTYALWVYGAGYFVLGLMLLGAVSRWWHAGSPALWRPFMLSVGSLAAALDIWSQPPGAVAGALLDRWMLALIALLAVALLARMLPNRITRWWLDVDRRLDDG